MVSSDFVEDRRVQGNVERSALSVEDHTRSLHRGVADTIALPRPHFREVLAPSLDIVVREASFNFRRTAGHSQRHFVILFISGILDSSSPS